MIVTMPNTYTDRGWEWLVLPVAGPFVTATYHQTLPRDRALFIVDGAFQLGAAALFAWELTHRDTAATNHAIDKPAVRLAPMAPGATAGVSLHVVGL
jgi:hypothetical protein